MPRQAITAERLHALLAREYHEARNIDCVTRCPMPMPVFRDAKGEDVANWHIPSALKCPRHCHRIVEAVAERLATSYNLLA